MPRNIHGKQNWEESDLKGMVMVQEHYYVGKGSHLRIFFFFKEALLELYFTTITVT